MDFITLETEIHALVKETQGELSLSLKTEEGEFNIREHETKSAASVIKVPIAMACLYACDNTEVSLDQEIVLTDPVGGSGVLCYMHDMEKLSLRDAIILSIIVSDNTAANVVIDAIGMESAIQFFQLAGAENTQLRRKFMDHESLKKGIDNVTTAGDMNAFLLLLDEGNDLLSKESKAFLKETLHNQQLKDKLPSYQNMFAESVTVGNKTGTLDGVEHDIAYFQSETKTVYISVLVTGLNKNADGQQTIAKIGQKVLEYMS